jgi:hypothetical protein
MSLAGLTDDGRGAAGGLEGLEYQTKRAFFDVHPPFVIPVIKHFPRRQQLRGGSRKQLQNELPLFKDFFPHVDHSLPCSNSYFESGRVPACLFVKTVAKTAFLTH